MSTLTNNSAMQIGWSSRDVTPDRPVNLYGQFYVRISKGAKDPVTVSVLALSSGASATATVVFVSCDSVYVPENAYEQCLAAIRKLVPKFDCSRIIMNGTHTHTAPALREGLYPPVPAGVMQPQEYAEFFAGRVAEAVKEAWENRRPGGISFGLGTAVVGHNRRATYSEADSSRRPGAVVNGFTRMYGNTNDPTFSHIEGYEDHYVNLLYTWDGEGHLTGVVVNLACPSQETEMGMRVSADFWHEIRTEIRRRHGGHIQVLAQCSAAGDQSPHRLWYKAAEERMLALRGLTMRQEIGRRVANAVDDVLPAARASILTRLPFRHIVREVELPRRMVTDDEADQARADLASLEAEARTGTNNYRVAMRCRRVLQRHEQQTRSPVIPTHLHVIRLGDVAFATNRFELFLDYGIRIKARSPAVQTFLVQLTADEGWTGTYLPSERAVANRGYGGGVYDSEVGPAGGRVIVEETVKALNELWPGHGADASNARMASARRRR